MALIRKAVASNFFPTLYKLTFAVTYKCNSKCKTCNIWKKKPDNELTTEEIEKFFKENRFPWVNLTGGEVFLRNDVLEIVKAAFPEVLNITTNGIATKRIVDIVRKILPYSKRTVITVSIDGPEKIHNKIKGVNSWIKSVATYSEMRKIEAQHKNFKTFIGFTISEYNAEHLENMYNEIRMYVPELEMSDIHLNLYHDSNIYFSNKKQPNTDWEQKALKILAKHEKKGFDPVSILDRKYMRLAEKYLKNKKCPLPCKSLLSSVFIEPNGDVYPCIIFSKKLGNIRKQSLKQIIKNSGDVRKSIKRGECPQCWTPCEAYQTIIGNVLRC